MDDRYILRSKNITGIFGLRMTRTEACLFVEHSVVSKDLFTGFSCYLRYDIMALAITSYFKNTTDCSNSCKMSRYSCLSFLGLVLKFVSTFMLKN